MLLIATIWVVLGIGDAVAGLAQHLPLHVRSIVVNHFINVAVAVIARTAGA